MTNRPSSEDEFLKATNNCTDEDGLPVMQAEAPIAVALEASGFIQIAGEHQNRAFILPAGRDRLSAVNLFDAVHAAGAV